MRSSPRGATLVEVMVVGSIFFMMFAAIMAIYFSTSRAQRLIGVKSDVDRELMAAVRHVDGALKSSRLIAPKALDEPVVVDRIELLPLQFDSDGTPLVTAAGFPEWGPPYSISYEEGKLVRSTPTRRVFATLGERGFVRFIRPSNEMLEMEIKVERLGTQEYKSARQTTFQFRLFNQ